MSEDYVYDEATGEWLSPAEAAEVMGTPVGTVRSRLHYALKHLRAAVEADARYEAHTGTA